MTTVKSNGRFLLGQVMITPGALQVLPAREVWESMQRHVQGDWGDICEGDWKLNDDALKHEGRLLSRYLSKRGTRFWIITEWDRSLTTVLLPEEY